MEIAAEMTFPGRAPVKPNLNYRQRHPSIQTLVATRKNPGAILNMKLISEPYR